MARHPRSDDTDADSGFVSRWSRRKQQASVREQGEIEAEGNQETPLSKDAVEAEPQSPEKTDADMPPLESITETSNVADFFSPGVSDQLRKMALRKLFRGAKFNIRDGLDDYDEDFRNFAPLGDIVTADMKHQQELAEERERQALAEKEKLMADEAAETTEENETRNEEQAVAAQQEPLDEPDTDEAGEVAMDVTETEEKTKEEEIGA